MLQCTLVSCLHLYNTGMAWVHIIKGATALRYFCSYSLKQTKKVGKSRAYKPPYEANPLLVVFLGFFNEERSNSCTNFPLLSQDGQIEREIQTYTLIWKRQVCLRKTENTVISVRRATLDSDEHSNNEILACLHSHAFSIILLKELSRQNLESCCSINMQFVSVKTNKIRIKNER